MKTISTIAIASCLFVICAAAQSTPIDTASQAHAHYAKGNYVKAIELWRQSLPKLQDKTEVVETHLNIGLSQRALGFPVRACRSYVKALKLDTEICRFKTETNIPIQSSGNEIETRVLISMTNLLRDVGQFSQATEFLKAGLSNAKQLNSKRLEAAAQLSQSKLILDQLKIKRDRLSYQNIQEISSKEAQAVRTSLIDAYRNSESAIQSSFKTDAIIRWFEIYQEHKKWLTIIKTNDIFSSRQANITQYLSEFNPDDIPETLSFQKAKFYFQLAQILKQLADEDSSNDYIQQAFEASMNSLEIAGSIDNSFLLSSAYGQLAQLYKSTEQFDDAIQALNLGIHYADSLGNEKLLFKWHRDRATLFEIKGNDAAALSDYEAAIKYLQALDTTIQWLPSELRTEYTTEVQPVFEAFLSNLLSQPQPNFKQVLQVQDQLSQTLLQNYLGCSTLENAALTEFSDQSENTIVSIIKAENRYHTIALNQGNIYYSQTNAAELDELLQQIHLILRENNIPPESLLSEKLQNIYKKLLEPTIKDIPDTSALLFRSLDPNLQQLPMAMLYDGQSYLIEKYPIALIGYAIYEPKELDIQQSDILFAGISRPDNHPNFSDLPFVESEKNNIAPNTTLLNQRFTKDRFLNHLQTGNTVVHIASHGQFSSNPDETFLLAWDEKITIDAISSIVSDRALNTSEPIELLVLSACQTAKGDLSASLGLAGIAVQSGARSTVASFWQADDESTAQLMDDFYQSLRNGRRKAESLQLAQIKQIKLGRSPYFWGNFVLIGNWL